VFDELSAFGARGTPLMSENSQETPEADLLEQQADATAAGQVPDGDPVVPLEADPADAAEQSRDLGLDDDEDYR
jgi:hypothetical protein